MQDFTERAEDFCEWWASENIRGGEMTCSCGKTCPLNQAEPLSPDPFAIPVCPDCFNKAVARKNDGSKGRTTDED